MIYTIKNDFLTVDIDSLGAQLSSIRTPERGEHLWQGDPDIWARRAPVLFPTIGRLKDRCYLLDGEKFTIGQHGFARDMEFAVTGRSDTSVTFRITDTEETRRAYPFAFSLSITYAVEGNRLVKSHRVENRSDRPMLYELGAHDGFRLPPEEGPMSGWSVRLPGVDELSLYGMDGDCLLTRPHKTWRLDDGRLSVFPWDYDGLNTVVLDAPARAEAQLLDPWGEVRITLSFADFPYLGVWTERKDFDTHYVCIEPWSSLPDCSFAGRELADKPGVRTLAPGRSEVLAYTTTIHK